MALTHREAELEAEVERLRVVIASLNESFWHQTHDRFHGFDAIKDDLCPCCGGPVVVERSARAADGRPEGVRLVATRL